MKLSLDWLCDYIEFAENNPHVIADRLTVGVAEIERVEKQGELLDDVVIGKVLTVEKHPNADKLSICIVQTDRGEKRVVCGGTNLYVGMLTALAHVGAKVKWHGEEIVELKETKIRGEMSHGMICAASELDLSDAFTQDPDQGASPIIDFSRCTLHTQSSELVPGALIKDIFGLNDTIFHVNNHSITHRADLFSHIGFARECVALGLGTWKKKPEFPQQKFPKYPIPFSLSVERNDLMPRYLSCVIHVDGLGETPEWMTKRLRSTGWRTLNLPVDITNYVAMEVGIPLHSFDVDDIRGNVIMRPSKKGETIVTLDKKEHVLPDGALVLSDDEGIFDLLGIMGGLRSSTKSSTRNIYLHSAALDPVSIRNAVIATGHRTDAATVYEKGVPFVTVQQGFFRALQLFLDLMPGAEIRSVLESHGDNGESSPISLSMERVTRLLGKEVDDGDIYKILASLDCKIRREKRGIMEVIPPLHRTGDLHHEADLIEEIARISGFETFDNAMPEAGIMPPLREKRLHSLRDALKDSGFHELVSISMTGEDKLRQCAFQMMTLEEIRNPFGEDLKYMRPSLLSGILEAVVSNIHSIDSNALFFEIGRVFARGKEHRSMGILLAPKKKTELNSEPFLLLKSSLKRVLKEIGYDVTFKKTLATADQYHPLRTAEIIVQNTNIGEIAEIHPRIVSACGLPARAAFAQVNVDELLSLIPVTRQYQPPPSFPTITYDTTVTIAQNSEVSLLLEKSRSSSPLIQSIALADIFRKGDEHNLTFRCTYSASDRTLTEEEVKPIHGRVEEILRGK